MIDDELRRSSTHVLVDTLDDLLVLDPSLEHHLRRVLRLSTGETVSATDGAVRVFAGGEMVMHHRSELP